VNERPPAGADAAIWLARHGETDDNRKPLRIQGHRDVALNDTGRDQAAHLARRVAGCTARIGSLYSSHLIRALDTARIVADVVGLEPVIEPRLAESDRGDWEGRSWEDVAAQDPRGFAAWRAAGPGFRFPGGESLAEHSERVDQALHEIRDGGPLPALLVCHGGTIRVALCRAAGLGLEAFHDFEVPNGSLLALT
jgi:2,3-bisphosphoglycerate-dependent phosphoglycerate mutase